MAYLFVKHTVNDFDAWKTVFDAMAEVKRAGGWIGGRVLRGTINPNEVVVLDEYRTLEDARAWAQSSQLRVAMGQAGVNGTPEVSFLDFVV